MTPYVLLHTIKDNSWELLFHAAVHAATNEEYGGLQGELISPVKREGFLNGVPFDIYIMAHEILVLEQCYVFSANYEAHSGHLGDFESYVYTFQHPNFRWLDKNGPEDEYVRDTFNLLLKIKQVTEH